MLRVLFPVQNIVEGYVMAELTMMLFEKGPENNIRGRAINEWFKMDSYVSLTENFYRKLKR